MISSDEGTFGASCQDEERVGLIQSLKVLPKLERVPPSPGLHPCPSHPVFFVLELETNLELEKAFTILGQISCLLTVGV